MKKISYCGVKKSNYASLSNTCISHNKLRLHFFIVTLLFVIEICEIRLLLTSFKFDFTNQVGFYF